MRKEDNMIEIQKNKREENLLKKHELLTSQQSRRYPSLRVAYIDERENTVKLKVYYSVLVFGTTISPWIVTLDALEPFACGAPNQVPQPLPYLAENISKNYGISLKVRVKPGGQEESFIVTRTNFNHLYWTLTLQLAHHTINGCNLRPGDLLGTGTISGLQERAERERKGDLDQYERLDGDRNHTTEYLVVKKNTRTAEREIIVEV